MFTIFRLILAYSMGFGAVKFTWIQKKNTK
jgi:hypothetical protein